MCAEEHLVSGVELTQHAALAVDYAHAVPAAATLDVGGAKSNLALAPADGAGYALFHRCLHALPERDGSNRPVLASGWPSRLGDDADVGHVCAEGSGAKDLNGWAYNFEEFES